jgi:UDPglucose 6-dehydrogenase
MNLSVIGTGYVGLTTGACLAKIGHNVICVDNDYDKIKILNNGELPIYEPGLKEIIAETTGAGRLFFTTDTKIAIEKSDVCFIAVGTPPLETGEPDLTFVETVVREIAKWMNNYRLIVEKSTVPVQTAKWIRKTIERYNNRTEFDVACNPEFLREGSAVQDFLNPDRIVIGVESQKARNLMLEIYAPIKAPIIVTDLTSAELIKHASNAFLAMKISFINAISFICEATGADVCEVANGIGMDKRIGRTFLNAGIGYGGFCFPKDLRAFIRIAEEIGYDFRLLREVERINEDAKTRFIRKIRNALWNIRDKTIGILGLSFKPNTDDMRFAPSIDIINCLLAEGAIVRAYDPQSMEKAKKILPDVELCPDPFAVANNADLLAILTEWDEFRELDWQKIKTTMRLPIIADGRNMLNREQMEKLGFIYIGVGR